MTCAAVVTAFQTLHAAITGVQSAPTAFPASLTTAVLPLVLTRPGPTPTAGGLKGSAGDWYEHRRIYLIDVYVKPLAQGAGVDEGYQLAITLLDRFIAAYMVSSALNLSGAVAHVGPAYIDTGIVPNMRYGADSETLYWGFQFRIEVVEKVAP